MREPMTWSGEDRRHMIDRPRFGLEEPPYRDYIALRCLGLEPGMAMADIGCGSGASTLTLIPYLTPGGSITGFDRDPEVLRHARANAAALGLEADTCFREADATALPVENGAFDVTTCQTVLMHVADADAVLREMVRVTRPGGTVAATEPDWSTMAIRNLNHPPPSADDAALWAHGMSRILEGGRRRGSGDWSIGVTLTPLFRRHGLLSVRTRPVPASWIVAPSSDGRRADGALRWAIDLFYPEPGSELHEAERQSYLAAGNDADGWDRFEALRARDRARILADHEADHALLHVHTAAYLTVGRTPGPAGGTP